MKTNYQAALLAFLTAANLFLAGCTKNEETAAMTLPDTKAFRVTHNLELSDMAREREIAASNKQTDINALFANKAAFDFNFVAAGQTSPIVEFNIYSVISQEVMLTSLSITGPNAKEFLLLETPDFPTPLRKETSFKAKVMFSPRNSGQKTATMLVSSQSHGVLKVDLTGNAGGSPELKVSLRRPEGEYAIPNHFAARVLEPTKPLPLGACPDLPQKFIYQVSNPALMPLTVKSAKLEGVHAGLFQFTAGTLPLVIQPKGSANLTVEFPGGQAEGTYLAELKVESDDANESMYTVPLRTYTLPPTSCLQAAFTSKPNEVPEFQPLFKKPRRALGVLTAETTALFTLQLKNSGFAPIQIPADKVTYALSPKPPISMLLQIPATGINLEPGQTVAIPLSIATSNQRVPFSAEVRFAMSTPAADPAGPPVITTLTTVFEGVVGTAAPAVDITHLSVRQAEPVK